MSSSKAPPSPEEAVLPDIRLSICHTALAAGFLLLNIQNPYKLENVMYLIIMCAMPVVAVFSWYFFFKRLKIWKRIPADTRNRVIRSPAALKNRAFSHMLMSLLAASLTALGYIGHLIAPLEQQYGRFVEIVVLSFDALIGVVAIAVLSRTIRDLVAFFSAQRS